MVVVLGLSCMDTTAASGVGSSGEEIVVDGAGEQWAQNVIWPIVQVDVIKAVRWVCGCSEGVATGGRYR